MSRLFRVHPERLTLLLVAVMFAQVHYGSRFADSWPAWPVVTVLSGIAAGACILAAVHLKRSWWAIARLLSIASIIARLIVVLAAEMRPGHALNDRPGSVFLVVGIDGLTLLGLAALFYRVKPGAGSGQT